VTGTIWSATPTQAQWPTHNAQPARPTCSPRSPPLLLCAPAPQRGTACIRFCACEGYVARCMLLHVARCTLHAAACCTLHVARCMLLHVAAHCIAARYSHERTTALTGSSALDCCCCCNARSTAYTMQRTGHERVQRNEVVEDDVPKVDRPVAAQLSSASCSIQYTACNIQRAACNTQHSRCKTQPCKVQPCNTQPKHAARMKRGPSKLPRKYSPQRVTCSVRSQGRDQGLRLSNSVVRHNMTVEVAAARKAARTPQTARRAHQSRWSRRQPGAPQPMGTKWTPQSGTRPKRERRGCCE
jgi:hypothetical protein